MAVSGWRGVSGGAASVGRRPMKALSIGLVAGAALCSVMPAPASAMPISNLAAAASDLMLGQSVRYVCNRYRCRWRPNYSYRGYYGYGPSYYGYGRSYYGHPTGTTDMDQAPRSTPQTASHPTAHH